VSCTLGFLERRIQGGCPIFIVVLVVVFAAAVVVEIV